MNIVKCIILALMAVFLAACGDSLREEYESLNNQAPAATAEGAKTQLEEVNTYLEKLRELEEDGEELPEGLVADAKTLQAKRTFRFGGLAVRQKAVQYWESVKGAFASAGISMAKATEQDPELKVITAREEPNDDWESYK